MIEWIRKRKLWQLPLLASIISILCWVEVAIYIMTNQTSSIVLLASAIVTTLGTLALVGIAIWQLKRHQYIPKTQKQTSLKSLKANNPSFLILGFGVLFIAVGLWIAVILGISNPYAVVLFGVGIVVFLFGIAKMGSTKKPPSD